MAYRITSLLLAIIIYSLLINLQSNVMATSSSSTNMEQPHHVRSRPILRIISSSRTNQYPRLKSEMVNDFLGK